MDRNDAHKLIRQYASTVQTILDEYNSTVATTTIKRDTVPVGLRQVLDSSYRDKLAHIPNMAERCGEHGERKMMRWLGYVQGVLVAFDVYTLDEVKVHSKERRVTRPAWMDVSEPAR